MGLELRRLSHPLGAEVCNIDVTKLTESEFGEIYRAFLDHCVLLFRARRSLASSTSNSVRDSVRSTTTRPFRATVILSILTSWW